MPAENPMVFQFIFEDVLTTLQTFVTTTSANMATIAGAVGSSLFALYVLFWGIAILGGKVQEPFMDGALRIIRGVVILAFATSAGIYSSWVVDFFTSVPGSIAAEVAQAGSSGGYVSGSDMATAQMLDSALGNGLKAGQEAWNNAAAFDIGASVAYGLIAICIWIFVALVCAYGGALVLVANMGLSIMLGLGPLFIVMAMFNATQQLFVAWTRQLITFAVFFIVLAATMTLTFSFFTPFIETLADAQATAGDVSRVAVTFIKLVCFCAASVIVLWKSNEWASGLAGGVSVAAAGAVGRMVSGGSHGLMHSHYNPNSGRHDLRGAVPAVVRSAGAVVTAPTKLAAYMRRNQIKKD